MIHFMVHCIIHYIIHWIIHSIIHYVLYVQVREDSFDTRMQVVAGAHSSLFKDLTHDKPVLRASTSSVSGGATGSE